MDSRTKTGFTTEGLPCEVILYYVPDALDGELPERITGHFQAKDGGGSFEIVRDGEVYRDSSSGDTQRQPADLLPWVVAEGMW